MPEQIEARRKKKLADSYEQRLKDMDSFLEKQTFQIPEFLPEFVVRIKCPLGSAFYCWHKRQRRK